mmetsp:Transcript_85678/g.223284  ORF Transcript_85678/g.223284 Transcript_85678/m.223284 type:complete len:738 (+) Transcript_85678:32-2245(+)
MGSTDPAPTKTDAALQSASAEGRPQPAARRGGPDYVPPGWAGKPGPPLAGSEIAIELLVQGEVQKRILLDTEAYDTFLIGRAANCDVSLEGFEPQSSRFHCMLQCKEGSSEIYVYDLKSSHGTMLNGRSILPHTFEPMRIGEQLRFCADKPASCIAVLCGPEDAMPEEGVVDLDAFRAKAAKDRAALLKAQQADLQRRKDSKKLRLAKLSHQQQVVKVLSAKARQQQKVLQVEAARDRAKLHEVSWGQAEDAVDVPVNDYTDEANKLMNDDGKLDFEKVRELKLTEKQEGLVKKAEQKQKRIDNLLKEKERLQEALTSRAKKDAESEFEIDVPDGPSRGSGGNMEKLQGVETKLERSEEEMSEQTDNILLSLGFKLQGDKSTRISKRRVAMYDTRNIDDEDDAFFDRTIVRNDVGPNQGAQHSGTELVGLPDFDGVETKATIEMKVGMLNAEQAHLSVKLAAEMLKARQLQSNGGGEDELDSYMGSTMEELSNDRRAKLHKRLAAVDARLKEGSAMLRVAKRNADETPVTGPAVVSASRAAASAAGVLAASGSKEAAAAGSIASQKLAKQLDQQRKGVEGSDKVAESKNTSQAKPRTRQPRIDPGNKVAPTAEGEAESAQAADAPTNAGDADALAAAPSSSSSSAPPAAGVGVARAAPVKRPVPEANRVKIDPNVAGLQVQPSKQAVEAMPPPAVKKRKVYGAALPPPSHTPAAATQAAASRDADLGDSGELDEPEG